MAYLLRFDGVNDYVSGQAPLSVTTASAFAMEVTYKTDTPAQSDRKMYRLGDRNNGIDLILGQQSDGRVRLFVRRSNQFVTIFTSVLLANQSYKVRAEVNIVTGLCELFLDDVPQGSATPLFWESSFFTRTRIIGSESSSAGWAKFDLFSLKEFTDGNQVSNYDPSASNGTGTTLIDTVGGNNGTLVNFPSNNSQWVFYDDGAGSTEQITSSGGIASALAGGAASTQIINEQVLSASGFAAAVGAGIASATIVNEQVNSSGGIASAVANAITSTSVINEQALSSGGIAAAIAGATASTQVINEQTSEQIVSSGGIAASTGSASASTQIISEQVVSSGGVAAALAGGTASSTVIEDYAIVQVVQSGGISSAYMSGIASTSQVIEQIVSSGGVAAAVTTGSASTIVRELSGDWGAPEILFSEAQPIEQISLTFDQLGRPLVFYRIGENTLKLYWYDPVAQQNVTTTLTTGKDPTACFDFPQDTGQSFTDALLFYVRDDQVFMRIQRDRYAIEYPCPAIQPGLKINSAGLRVDNRLQVVYQFKDDGYVPPVVPVPPVVVPGRFYYLHGYWNSGIETTWRMSSPITESEFEVGMLITSGTNNSRISLYRAALNTTNSVIQEVNNGALFNTLFCITPGIAAPGLSLDRGYAEIALRTTNGNWLQLLVQNLPPFEFMLNRSINSAAYCRLRMLFGERLTGQSRRNLKVYGRFWDQSSEPEGEEMLLADVDVPAGFTVNDLSSKPINSRLFYGVMMVENRANGLAGINSRPLYAATLGSCIADCYIKSGGVTVSWPISANGEQDQDSIPIGHPAKIINHQSVRWRFVQD